MYVVPLASPFEVWPAHTLSPNIAVIVGAVFRVHVTIGILVDALVSRLK